MRLKSQFLSKRVSSSEVENLLYSLSSLEKFREFPSPPLGGYEPTYIEGFQSGITRLMSTLGLAKDKS
jgi:hypothetical protein